VRVQVPNAMGQFFGGRTCPGVPDDTVVSCAKTAEPIKMLFGLTRVGPRKHVLDEGPDPPYEETVFSRKDMPVHPQRHSAVRWLNGSRCHLVSGLRGPNEAAAMRHYVKLL